MKRAFHIILAAFALVLAAGCEKDGLPDPINGSPSSSVKEREISPESLRDHVFIMYLAGVNNLTGDMANNISELCQGELPGRHDRNAVVIISQLSEETFKWDSLTPVNVIHAYEEYEEHSLDTVKTLAPGTSLVRKDDMKEALCEVRRLFPSKKYTILFSSHATGWIPKEYNHDENKMLWMKHQKRESILAQYQNDLYHREEWNLDADEFRDALPMHFETIIFDCCLMGGVETTYSMREKCDYIIACPTEVLSIGFAYDCLAKRVLMTEDGKSDLKGICDDFAAKTTSMTIAIYDCSKMDALADTCAKIFPKYSDRILNVNPNDVQAYNNSYSYHYDFRDILAKLGISEEEMMKVNDVLKELIPYKLATKTFLGHAIDPNRFSGMSMYLPKKSTPKLNDMYKSCEWNVRTGLYN